MREKEKMEFEADAKRKAGVSTEILQGTSCQGEHILVMYCYLKLYCLKGLPLLYLA